MRNSCFKYTSDMKFKVQAIYFTYNSVNTTIKDYRFVYSYMFGLD